MSFFKLRRIMYAVALLVIGVLIWLKRRRRRQELWEDEEDDDEMSVRK